MAHFDKLHFSECTFGAPIIEGRVMRVRVEGLFVLGGHPLLAEGDGPYCEILCSGELRNRNRDVMEYIGDPKKPEGFKEQYRVADGPFAGSATGPQTEFGFEGIQASPSAWIDWIVHAESFELVVDDSRGRTQKLQ